MKLKKIIHTKLLKLIDDYLIQQSQNTYRERNKRSLSSTVDYIESKMLKISSVTSRLSVHKVAINNISIDGLVLEFGVFKGKLSTIYPRI